MGYTTRANPLFTMEKLTDTSHRKPVGYCSLSMVDGMGGYGLTSSCPVGHLIEVLITFVTRPIGVGGSATYDVFDCILATKVLPF